MMRTRTGKLSAIALTAAALLWLIGGGSNWWNFPVAVAADPPSSTAAVSPESASKVPATAAAPKAPQASKTSQSPIASHVVHARFDVVSDVSPAFQSRAKAAVGTIPAGVWKTLRSGGWQVRIAEFVVDAAPSLRGVQPRGWPTGSTWDNTDAVHLPARRMLVFAEKRRTRDGRIVPSSRVESVFRHEVGHAFDRATGAAGLYQSAGAGFMFAYHRDVTRMPEKNRTALNYYLQRGAAGRQEAFAEAFAILLGGGSDAANRSRFESGFPTVMRYVRKAITDHDTKAASYLAQSK